MCPSGIKIGDTSPTLVSSLLFEGTELDDVIGQLPKESSSTNINTLRVITVAANSVSSHEILAAPGAWFTILKECSVAIH